MLSIGAADPVELGVELDMVYVRWPPSELLLLRDLGRTPVWSAKLFQSSRQPPPLSPPLRDGARVWRCDFLPFAFAFSFAGSGGTGGTELRRGGGVM